MTDAPFSANTFLNAISHAIIAVDPVGEILYANTQARDVFPTLMLKQNIESLVNMAANDVYPDLNFEQLAKKLQEESATHRAVHVRFDKHPVHWLEVQFNFSTEDEAVIVLEIKDASDLKRIQATQDYREALLDNVLQHSKEAVIAFDEVGAIEFFSPAAEQMFNYNAAELLIEDVDIVFNPEEQENYQAILASLTEDSDISKIIARDMDCVDKSGKTFPASTVWSKSAHKNLRLYFVTITDITLLKNFMHSIQDAYVRADDNGTITDINPQAETYFSVPKTELLGQKISVLGIHPASTATKTPPDSNSIVSSPNLLLNKFLKSENPEYCEEFGVWSKELGVRITQITAWPQVSGNGKLYNILFRDLTLKKLHEEQLICSAYTDALTQIHNRAYFTKALNVCIEHAIRNGEHIGLILFDLDKFKVINDTLGHDYGDELLIEVARRLKRCIRENDIACRMGGDEFTVILRDICAVDIAAKVCQRILESCAKPYFIKQKNLICSASVGLAIFPQHAKQSDDLIKAADIAMYQAKQLGKDCFVEYCDDLRLQQTRRIDIENGLKNAIRNDEFSLHFQPKLRAPEMLVYSVEALLRWHSEKLGQVHPGEFIPIAEEAGLIIDITRWVLKESTQQYKRWVNESSVAMQHLSTVSVNISAVHLAQNLVRDVIEAIHAAEILPECLDIELTESAVMGDVHRSAGILRSLRSLGISISIDDFGTGYSSMKYLRMLPFDTVKIDRSFVNNIATDEHNRFIVEAIISIAYRLGNAVVAEGVETEKDIEELVALGCIGYQGFYFAKPMPAEKVIPFIVENTQGTTKAQKG